MLCDNYLYKRLQKERRNCIIRVLLFARTQCVCVYIYTMTLISIEYVVFKFSKSLYEFKTLNSCRSINYSDHAKKLTTAAQTV